MQYIGIIFAAVFLSNILLNSLIGFPLYNKATKLKDVVQLGLKVTIVAFVSTVIIYPINEYLLKPESWTFLTPIMAILIVLNLELLMDYLGKKFKLNYLISNESKPIIIVNALVFAISLIMVNQINYFGAIFQAVGFGLGYLLVTVLIYTIKPRLDLPGVPKAFKGIPLMLITLGIIGMIFVGLGGIL